MINFFKTTKTKLIATLSALTVACFVLSLCLYVFPLPSKVTAETQVIPEGTYMEMTSEEMVWTGNHRGVTETSGSSTGDVIGSGGALFYPVKKPLMTVWHMPKDVKVTLSSAFRRNGNISSMANANWTELYCRVVHYHADTGLNEVVYPADGGWYDLSTSPTDENGKFQDVRATNVLNVSAGDQIKMIVWNKTGTYNYCETYVTGAMYIHGASKQWIDQINSGFAHINSEQDTATPTTTSQVLIDYFDIENGTTKADVLTYEYVDSFTDRVVKYEPNLFTYMDKLVVKTDEYLVDPSKYGKQNLLWGANLTGAEYIGHDFTNNSGDDIYVRVEVLAKKAGNSDVYGIAWAPAEYSYCYLIDQYGTMSTVQMVNASDTRGKVLIPANFSGQIIFPVEEFERSGYRFGTALDGITSDYDAFIPSTNYRFDYIASKVSGANYLSDGSVTFSNLTIYADDLSSRGVALTENRAIQLISKIGNVTLGSESAIEKARNAYDGLSDNQKQLVTNYQTLLDAEQEFASLRYNSYVYSDGKDFTGTGGVYFGEEFTSSPSTVSAWVKVPSDIADKVHVGTVIGNGTKQGSSMEKYESGHNFALKITTNGNPQLTWRVDRSKKAIFTVTNVDVRTDKWMHVAFTRDVENNTLYCYVNGVLAGQETFATAGALGDISMAYRNVMIGSDHNDNVVLSVGETPTFNGSIAHARVYSTMLSNSDIVCDMEGDLLDGLMGSVDFKNGESGVYSDDVISDAYDAWAWQTATIDDLKADSDEFTMAVLGDTQMLLSQAVDKNGVSTHGTKTKNDKPLTYDYDITDNIFYKNVQWLIANKDALNLEFVMHMGDLTDNLNSEKNQDKGKIELEYGIDWMSLLSKNGIRWSLVRGNHDGGFSATYSAKFDAKYSYKEFGGLTDGAYASVANTTTDESGNEVTTYTPANMRNVYYTFNALGKDYLIITLDIQPSDAELAWAGEVISSHPTHRAIITTHAYMGKTGDKLTDPMTGDGNHMNTGDKIWDKLASQYKNVIMVLCGHSDGVDVVRTESKGIHGNTVYEFMIDESTLEWAGSRQTGVFALLNFSNGGDTVTFNYYSPTEGKLFRAFNQFSIELNPAEYLTDTSTLIMSKDQLENIVTPSVISFNTISDTASGGIGYIPEGSTSAIVRVNGSNLAVNKAYSIALAFDVAKTGVFRFTDESYIEGHTTDEPRTYFTISVVDGKTGQAKRWFPATDSGLKHDAYALGEQGIVNEGYGPEYMIKGGVSDVRQSFYLSNAGSINVDAGDRILLQIRCSRKSTNYFKIISTITESDGTLTTYSLGNLGNKQSTTSLNNFRELYNIGYGNFNEDGTPKNHKGYTVGAIYHGGTPYRKVTVNDNLGNTVDSLYVANSAVYKLPEIQKTGYQHIGYSVDGKLYPIGYEMNVTANTTITAVYAQLAMMNAASLRIDEVSGIRFSTFSSLGVADFEELSSSVEFGTLIARAQDVTTDNAFDYSLINLENSAVIKLVSNVQTIVGRYTNFNGGLVEIKESHYDWIIGARGYMTVTYADGTIKTFYAEVSDNARSVKDIATTLLSDISKIQTSEYKYAVDGGYSKYDIDATNLLKAYAGL